MSSSEKDLPAGQAAEPSSAAPAASPVITIQTRARQAKLRLALAALKQGKVNTASALLFEIYRDHAGTPESTEAALALTELAEQHEAAGRHRMAAAIYDSLAEE